MRRPRITRRMVLQVWLTYAEMRQLVIVAEEEGGTVGQLLRRRLPEALQKARIVLRSGFLRTAKRGREDIGP